MCLDSEGHNLPRYVITHISFLKCYFYAVRTKQTINKNKKHKAKIYLSYKFGSIDLSI